VQVPLSLMNSRGTPEIDLVPSMPINELILAPNVKTVPDTRDIDAVSVFYGRPVRFVLHHERVDDAIAAIDEMHAILGQRPLRQLQRVDRRMWRMHLTGTLRADLNGTHITTRLPMQPSAGSRQLPLDLQHYIYGEWPHRPRALRRPTRRRRSPANEKADRA